MKRRPESEVHCELLTNIQTNSAVGSTEADTDRER